MLDGELDSSQHDELQSEIHSNPELNAEMNDHLAIRRAIQKDKQKLVPSIAIKESIFAAAGVTALTGSVSSSPTFWNTIFGSTGKIVLASIIGVIGTIGAFFIIDSNDSANNQIPDKAISVVQSKEIDLPVSKSEELVEETDLESTDNQDNNFSMVARPSAISNSKSKSTSKPSLEEKSTNNLNSFIEDSGNIQPDFVDLTSNEQNQSVKQNDTQLFELNNTESNYYTVNESITTDNFTKKRNFGFKLKSNNFKGGLFKEPLLSANVNSVSNAHFGQGVSGALDFNMSRISKSVSTIVSAASIEYGQFLGNANEQIIAFNVRISPDNKLMAWSNRGFMRPVLELKAGQFERFTVGGAIGMEFNTFFDGNYLQFKFNNLNTNYISIGLRQSF